MRLSISLFAVLVTLLTQQASGAEPLAATLEAHKVVIATNGKEQLVAASEARPGDVIEYRAIYRNTSDKALHAVMATLPVPATGVEYLLNSAAPEGALASIDGAQFAPPPLQRVLKMPDGKHRQQLVPPAEYRFLRWSLGNLPAGASKIVSARVRVIYEPGLSTGQK